MKNFPTFPKEPIKDEQFSLISSFELLRHIYTVLAFKKYINLSYNYYFRRVALIIDFY